MTKPELYNGVPIPYGATVDDLRHRVKTPGSEAWAACIALGHKVNEGAIETLEELSASEDWRYRRVAIEAMTAHRLAVTKAALFCSRLTDPSPYVVRTTCQAVAQLKLDCAHDSLRELVYSDDANTRSAALRALKALWQSFDFGLVFSVFQDDPSEPVRREAAWTLRENVDEDNWERLFEAWRIDPLHRHRVWACELASEFGDRNHMPTLQTMLKDSDGHVRTAASEALEKLSR